MCFVDRYLFVLLRNFEPVLLFVVLVLGEDVWAIADGAMWLSLALLIYCMWYQGFKLGIAAYKTILYLNALLKHKKKLYSCLQFCHFLK